MEAYHRKCENAHKVESSWTRRSGLDLVVLGPQDREVDALVMGVSRRGGIRGIGMVHREALDALRGRRDFE